MSIDALIRAHESFRLDFPISGDASALEGPRAESDLWATVSVGE